MRPTANAKAHDQPDALAHLFHSAVFNLTVGAMLGGLWGAFGYRHIVAFIAHGIWGHLLYGCLETVIALLFLCRGVPQTVSCRPTDWLVAVIGTFSVSFFSPAQSGVLPSASALIVLGIGLQLAALLSLNRSLAIVPAKRVIKTRGMYTWVRHPMYASHLVATTGYVLSNTTTTNVGIYVVTASLLLLRIVREEKHLGTDPLYRAYMHRVRYRLVPFVF
jgi:protein-S-isoprenylcysteine O-methyltransferase Ste14